MFFFDPIDLILDISIYLIIPYLYAAFRGWKSLIMPKSKRKSVCVASSILVFLATIPSAVMNYRLPNIFMPFIGGFIAYFTCEYIHKFVYSRR